MANLDPYNASSESECQAVLDTVGLGALVAKRSGINEPLSPDSLSQGQNQLFSLARAILRRRIRSSSSEKTSSGGILLLDEVSSSVDRDTDRLMQKIIMDEFANYTIVMVSHRLEMAMGFDKVVVMDKGSIVEEGNPTELLEREGGWFRGLCGIQNAK